MSNYVPVIICPVCSDVSKTTKQKIDCVLGNYFRQNHMTIICDKCKCAFIIATNWKAIKEETTK